MFWERRFGVLFTAVVLTILVVFIAMRVWAEEPYGEAITLCPGPDLYGYTCTTEGTAEYIDATNDTALYVDDGFIELELPFPFTFYGQTYTTLQASSNGSLTFGDEGNATFETFCPSPTDGVVPEMGDMIAPYWIDLDLTFVGYLEYEVVGTAPERIYVLEWDDIPLYSTGELVTFEVQLHEAGNNIFMLYQNVDLASGRDAVVAIQSEQQGLALTYSCLQPALANGLQLGFLHPEEANPALTAPSHTTAETQLFPCPAKEPWRNCTRPSVEAASGVCANWLRHGNKVNLPPFCAGNGPMLRPTAATNSSPFGKGGTVTPKRLSSNRMKPNKLPFCGAGR
ncbi:MAG: hypothetical protein IPL28_07985 [Chloroflexi bacterium]|nr:hypothetical protein [Chloroflexota bacterium]